MKRLLKEPLLHFLLAGAALFGLYALVNQGDPEGSDGAEAIVVSAARIKTLSENFAKVWQRPPNAAELDGLIQEFIREEIMYREAKAMGLDRDDTIVRRRMRQKMEFIFEDLASAPPPTDDQLHAFLRKHPDRFRKPPRVTFIQVFLNPQKRGGTLQGDAEQLLVDLKEQGGNADITKLGDGFLLGQRFGDYSERDLQNQFGKDFAAAIIEAPVKAWHGPVQSGYGLHLVYVSDRSEGTMPDLADVRDAVEREWSVANQQKANEAFYDRLKERYSIRVDLPESTPSEDQAKGSAHHDSGGGE